MKKKFGLSFIAAILVMMAFFTAAFSAEDSGMEGEPSEPAGTPLFELYKTQTFSVTAGEESVIEIKMQNVADAWARYINLTLTDDKGIIQFKSGSIKEIIGCTRRGIASTKFNVFVPAYVEPGRYPLSLAVTTTNLDYQISGQNFTIYLDVTSNASASGISVQDYSISKDVVQSEDIFDLKMKVKNQTGVDIKNADITLNGMDGSRFAIDSGMPNQTFDIKNNETKEITFRIAGCKGISSIREVISADITYFLEPGNKNTEQTNKASFTIPCKVSAANDPTNEVFAPNLIIDSYTFGEEGVNYVYAGKTFPLSLSVRNTSGTSSIKNLKVTIQGTAGVGDNGVAFSPANSSNSFFFEALGTGSSVNINIDLLAKADAKPDSYPINVIFEYEYVTDGKTAKAENVIQTLSVPLQQEDRFVCNSPELPSDGFLGQEFGISATFVNKGKSPVYNVTVDVEGDGFDKTSSSYYIGNIESGREEYYDTSIIPTMAGELRGEIVITYEDANGNQKEIRQEFITNIMEMSFEEPPMGGDMMFPGDEMPVDGGASGMPVWAVILICVGGAAVAAVVIVIVVKKAKKKKALKELEEDDEDN